MTRARRARVPVAAPLLVLLLALGAAPGAAGAAYWLPADLAGNDPHLAAAFGDSLTEGVLGEPPYPIAADPYPEILQNLLAPLHPGLTVLNWGKGGEATGNGIARLASLLAFYRPVMVVIQEGTNDATFKVSPQTIVANLRIMVQLVKNSAAVPVLGLLPPNHRTNAQQAQDIIDGVNALLPALAAEEGVRLVDTFSPLEDPALYGSDRLHPTQAGYQVLAGAYFPGANDALYAAESLTGGVTVAGAPVGAPPALRAVTGVGPGPASGVRMFGLAGAAFGPGFMPYDAPFLGGTRVAACDLDGDGQAEVVTGAGPGGGPHVMVFKLGGDGAPIGPLASFFAYTGAFEGGVFVACGDVDGDGVPEIVTGAGRSGGPHVRAFRYNAALPPFYVQDTAVNFFAYDAAFTGGVSVAVADLDGDGPGEILTGAGRGGGAHVRAFRYAPAQPGGVTASSPSFLAYDVTFTGGVFVAGGDLDGDGRAEIVTGAGPGGGPHVRVIKLDGALQVLGDLASFFAYVPEFRGGVFVGLAGTTVLTGAGPGGGPHLRGFTAAGTPTSLSLLAY